MRYPARCNRRRCQARRSLSKRPELYVKWPTCPCGGRMYVDWCRFQKREGVPVCWLDCYPFPHKVNSANCCRRSDWVIDQAFKASKHRPSPGEPF